MVFQHPPGIVQRLGCRHDRPLGQHQPDESNAEVGRDTGRSDVQDLAGGESEADQTHPRVNPAHHVGEIVVLAMRGQIHRTAGSDRDTAEPAAGGPPAVRPADPHERPALGARAAGLDDPGPSVVRVTRSHLRQHRTRGFVRPPVRHGVTDLSRSTGWERGIQRAPTYARMDYFLMTSQGYPGIPAQRLHATVGLANVRAGYQYQ